MPESYQPSSPSPIPSPREEEVEDSSTLSPASLLMYEGDDPDDTEWNPTAEKTERKKSIFK